MSTFANLVVSWPTLVFALIVFGFAPGVLLRVIVLGFRKADSRRKELLAELYAVPRLERPFWVMQQLEVAIFEGLWPRLVWAATGRIVYRWHLISGVKQHRRYPESFWIPGEAEKSLVRDGHFVKVFFSMRDGWGERMWVRVTEVSGRRIIGTLENQPVGIPRLLAGDSVKFTADHIIDIWPDDIIDFDATVCHQSA